MKSIRLILIVAVIGILLGYFLGTFLGFETLQNRAYLLALLAFGMLLGFLIDWLLEEASHRNRQLAQQLDQLRLESASPAQLHAPTPATIAPPAQANEIVATRALTDILHQQEDDLKTLRQHLDNTQQKMLTLRDETTQQLQTQQEAAQHQLQSLRLEFEAYMQTHPDDLTKIKGIGAVFQRKLRDLGVNTFQQLAEADPDKLRRLLGVKEWQKVDIAGWIAQSKDWL